MNRSDPDRNLLDNDVSRTADKVSERRRTEEGVLFQARMLDAVGEAVIATDVEGKVIYWNRAAEKIYGWFAEEMIGQALAEILVSEDLREQAAEIRSALREGKPWSGEFTVQRKDGSSFPVHVTDTPVHDDQGNLVGIIGVSTDITERKRAEAKLKESERRFATLLSNTPAMVYRCLNEPDWPEEYVSDYALELTGYPAAAFLENPTLFGSLISEEDKQRIWDEVQEAVGRGERFRLRFAIRHKDGGLRFVEELGQGVYDEEGNVVALEGLIYDVTDRERAGERLRKAEQRYRTLVERIPAVTFIDRADGSVEPLYISPQIEAMLGYTSREWMEGTLWRERLHPDDRERILASDERFEADGEPVDEEYRLLAKDGSVVWVREETLLVRNEADEPLFVQGILSNITERKEAEEALRRSEAGLAEAQRMAHLGSWEWDVRTGGVWWSNETFRIYGFEPQSFVPTFEKLLEVVHPEDRKMLGQALEGALYDDRPYDFEHRVVKLDGEMRVVHRRAEIVRGEDGEPIRMVGTVHDVTERKALE